MGSNGVPGWGRWTWNSTVWGNDRGPGTVRALYVFETDVQNDLVGENVSGGIRVTGNTVGTNFVWGNTGEPWDLTVDAGETDHEQDPLMSDPAQGDFSLDPGFSPAIDAGNPLPGYDDVDGSPNDPAPLVALSFV